MKESIFLRCRANKCNARIEQSVPEGISVDIILQSCGWHRLPNGAGYLCPIHNVDNNVTTISHDNEDMHEIMRRHAHEAKRSGHRHGLW